MERDKVPVTVMVCIDVALVVAMFIGLLRLRGRVGGLFGLVRLLWKQVRWWQFLVAVPNVSLQGCYLVPLCHRSRDHYSGKHSEFCCTASLTDILYCRCSFGWT